MLTSLNTQAINVLALDSDGIASSGTGMLTVIYKCITFAVLGTITHQSTHTALGTVAIIFMLSLKFEVMKGTSKNLFYFILLDNEKLN